MDEFDRWKKERSVARRLFTKNANSFEAILQDQPSVEWFVLYETLDEIQHNLNGLNAKINQYILEKLEEDDLEKEFEEALKYNARWLRLKHSYQNRNLNTRNNDQKGENSNVAQRNFKLPLLQLNTFDGEIKNWLQFWGQFSKINGDRSLDDTDKHQYLLQSMKDGTGVRSLVESFPPTAYNDCISQLKERYANEELLIQVYVREILALVLMKKDKNISNLYDGLNAQLRALATLGVTKDKYAAFLLPMVESAMPQELLRTWERTKSMSKDVAEELSGLLNFLKKEVDSEQRLEIARQTFKAEDPKILTAECLHAGVYKAQPKKYTQTCVWCDKETHSSMECYKVQKLTLEQRKQHLRDKKACAICLRKGHHPKGCKASVKCLICYKRHSTLLCEEQRLEHKPENKIEDEKATTLSVEIYGC